MKKLIFSAALLLSLGLTGCGNDENKIVTQNDPEQKAVKTDTGSVESTSTETILKNKYQEYAESVSPIMNDVYALSTRWDEVRQQASEGALSDYDFGVIIVNEILPDNLKNTEAVEAMAVDNEVVELHEKLIDMLNKQQSAFSEIASAIDKNDFSKITTANEYLSEVRKIERDYIRELEKYVEFE